jgi:hypothetical protein
MLADLADVSRLHTDAVVALLTAATLNAYAVEVTDDAPTFPYLVAYPDPGNAILSNLGGTVARFDFGWQVTAVGRDRNETQASLDKARQVYVGTRPVLAGRAFGLITQVPLRVAIREDPQKRDPVSSRPYFYGVAQFTVSSYPA